MTASPTAPCATPTPPVYLIWRTHDAHPATHTAIALALATELYR